ncbi:MAG: aminotransferase class I/II-fold pyridoxal phosphate-dependent enzyme [Anaerolineales bacterium]|nr:aminotransferase class I/II-fold pyridoxal phosphate-dependent enzyme [Anaerolineales bacterium]
MKETAKRLHLFTESVIREMTRIADQYGAINLSQGFPDFDPPKELVEAAVNALRSGYNQYGLTWGTKNFRTALAEKQSYFMGMPLEPDLHITATCGSTEAIMAALMTVCDPDDQVIIFSPVYENYIPDTILTGAKPIYVPLHPPDFQFDPEELRDAFDTGAKALILCNPSNPTGKVFTRQELEFIAALAQEYDAFIITDEVYEHIIYPPYQHTYIASLPEMFERTISCGSLSKTYAITGWRVGYTIAPEILTQGIRKVHDFLTIGAPTPLQEASVTALKFPQHYYTTLSNEYAQRKEIFLSALDEAGLKYVTPHGAYYVMVDISPFGFKDDTAFCRYLAKEIGVAAVPGSSFYPPTQDVPKNMIRLHFAKEKNTLLTAGKRLQQLKNL